MKLAVDYETLKSHLTRHVMINNSKSVLLFMINEESWDYLNDWKEDQLRKKRAKICMCCDHFRYAITVQCVTLLTCQVHKKLIPQEDHLIKVVSIG